MTLTYSRQRERFEAITVWGERRLPRAAGFRWDPKSSRWYTKEATTAVLLRDYADRLALPLIATLASSLEESRAEAAAVDVPAPEGLEYRPFQRAGIAYALQREGTLIGDEMGLGKTIQAIGVANAIKARNILVVCPASLCLNWQREMMAWLMEGGPLVSIASTKEFPGSHIVVCAYSRLTKHQHALRRREWDLIVLDESHYMKNPKAQRTVAVMGKWHKDPLERVEPLTAKHRLALTGTPVLNRPIELWPVLRWLDKANWNNWASFARRFCGARKGIHGWDTSGATNLDVLQDRLRATVMVRRQKSEVLKELPAKTRQVVLVEATAEARTAISAESRAWDTHQRKLEQLRTEVELAKASTLPEYRLAVARMREAMRLSLEEISRERHRVAIAKAPMVVEWVRDILEAGRRKVCVFAHHKDVVKLLERELSKLKYNPVLLTGDTPVPDRQGVVDQFQNDGSVRVFIGSITAAGVGLTLTASDHVVFAELDWVPANVSQAEDRVHRIGQQDAVLVQHIVFDGSLDQRMADLVVKKQQISDEALDLESAREPLLPSAPRVVSETRKAIEHAAARMTADDIVKVHGQLRALAQACDGATELDGQGFNRWDAPLGHKLAGLGILTPKQAALGARIVAKYRRQLGVAA